MVHKLKNGNDIQVVQKILEQELMDLSLSSVAQRLKGGKVSINWDKQNGIKSQVVQPILQLAIKDNHLYQMSLGKSIGIKISS